MFKSVAQARQRAKRWCNWRVLGCADFIGRGVKMTTPLNGDLTVPQVRVIEQLALGAWPGLEREDCGGWQLRCASGITRRANSVWPNEARDGLDVQDAIEYVERFYHGRNLPARFQICPAAQPRYLNEVLTGRGYRAVARLLYKLLLSTFWRQHWEAPVNCTSRSLRRHRFTGGNVMRRRMKYRLPQFRCVRKFALRSNPLSRMLR